MTTAYAASGLADEPLPLNGTHAAQDSELASGSPRGAVAQAWQRVIDWQLVEWGQGPESLAEEALVPPSREIIDLACKVAAAGRESGFPAPLRVVPDGEGGVSFERRSGEYFQSLNVLADGCVELLTFRNCKLVARDQLL